MRNTIRVVLAAVLIAAGILSYRANRPRPLASCFPEGEWTDAESVLYTSQTGEAGETPALSMTPAELQEAMAETTVSPRGKFTDWTCANLKVNIRVGERAFTVEVGEDGCIATADMADPEGSRRCWCARDGALFQRLTDGD